MPKLNNADFIKAVAAQLTPKHDLVVVGRVEATPVTGFGNQPAGSRFFSRRADVQGHMHKPGDYYCGRCMSHVVI
jgi:hypothetical protein